MEYPHTDSLLVEAFLSVGKIMILPGLSKCPVIRIKEAQATYGLLIPSLSKGADIRKLACKELVNATCRNLPFLSKGADIRKLACECYM